MLRVLEFVARDGSSPFDDIAIARGRWKDYKQRKAQEK
jgi:hypothetical protein